MLGLKEDTEYITVWKSKGLLKSRLHPLYNAFLPNIKCFGYKIGLHANNTAIVAKQNNSQLKI